MVCPVMQKQQLGPRLSDLPFEDLYRPWSWSLSSIVNISLLAFLIVFGWKMFRRSRRDKLEKKIVPLRICNRTDEEKHSSGNRVLVIGGCSPGGRALISALAEEEGVGEIDSLDLLIPGRQWQSRCVARYVQCDPGSAEDLAIVLRRVATVFVLPSLTVPEDGEPSTPDQYVCMDPEDVVNIVNCCRASGREEKEGEKGVRRLIVVTPLTDTARESEGGGGGEKRSKKVTEITCPDGATAAEKAVLEAAAAAANNNNNNNSFKVCIVRSGIVFAPLGGEDSATTSEGGEEEGDIDLEPDELCGNTDPEWPFHLVSSGHLARVLVRVGRRLEDSSTTGSTSNSSKSSSKSSSTSDIGSHSHCQVFIAYDRTCTGEDYEELCLPQEEEDQNRLKRQISALRRSSSSSSLRGRRRRCPVQFEVDDSETKRVLQL